MLTKGRVGLEKKARPGYGQEEARSKQRVDTGEANSVKLSGTKHKDSMHTRNAS
jgi:hypothetical protein